VSDIRDISLFVRSLLDIANGEIPPRIRRRLDSSRPGMTFCPAGAQPSDRPLRAFALIAGLAAPFALASLASAGDGAPSRNEVACLAEAIYFEARGTGEAGEAAVAHVVVNRTNDPEFPGSVCGVIRDGCQFSYRCDGRSDQLADTGARARAYRVAEAVLTADEDPTNGALFFHSAKARPGWFAKRERVARIGGNVFYR
jgi:N-acetylmuramoyl-L-alanine amidase